MIYMALIFAGISLLVLISCIYFFVNWKKGKKKAHKENANVNFSKMRQAYLKRSAQLWGSITLLFLILTGVTALAATNPSASPKATSLSTKATSGNTTQKSANSMKSSGQSSVSHSDTSQTGSLSASNDTSTATTASEGDKAAETVQSATNSSNSDKLTPDIDNQQAIKVDQLFESDDNGLVKVRGQTTTDVKNLVVSNTELEIKKVYPVASDGSFEFEYQLKSGDTELILYLCNENLVDKVPEDERVRLVLVPSTAFQEKYFQQLESSQAAERAKEAETRR